MSEILMPRLSDTMEEGVISAWHKQPGDEVAAGEVIADIETDKAIMEYEAYESGVLQQILVKEGDSAAIGAPIAVMGGDGAEAGTTAEPKPEPEPSAAPQAGPTSAPARPRSSPLARRVAEDLGVDIDKVTGSGPGGRIRRVDVEAAARQRTGQERRPEQGRPEQRRPERRQEPRPEQQRDEVADAERVKLSPLGKTQARRMAESKRTAPHFYLNRIVEVDALLGFRATLNESLDQKISVNDLIVRASARALLDHPDLNVAYDDDYLIRHKRIHVGVAVAIEGGLLVPVIRDADRKTISEIAAETRELAGRARERRLTPQEMSGSTFSVSNLGMFGIDSFSAVINPPEAAILAVGAARDEVVLREDRPATRKVLTLTLSVDHRATDGATGARFLVTLAELLENPLRIIA